MKNSVQGCASRFLMFQNFVKGEVMGKASVAKPAIKTKTMPKYFLNLPRMLAVRSVRLSTEEGRGRSSSVQNKHSSRTTQK